MIFRYSRLDSILAALPAVQLAGAIAMAAWWGELGTGARAALWPVAVFLAWYNPIVATHNFIHLPFFRSASANRVFAALNSINLGFPQILYRFHHLNHHRFGNDRGEGGRPPRDRSSTYAHGRGGRSEHVVLYATRSLFRSGTSEALRAALARGRGRTVAVQSAAVVAAAVALAALSPAYVLWFHLPALYVGWCLAHVENYYEHEGATPGEAFADSVSYYGRLYNAVFANEGYHQEHHLRPQAHWTDRPAVGHAFAPELRAARRRIARWPPLLGWLDRGAGSSASASARVVAPTAQRAPQGPRR